MQEPFPKEDIETHTVNGDMEPEDLAWISSALATAAPGEHTFTLLPGEEAQSTAQELSAMLTAAGCLHTGGDSSLMHFETTGLISESHTQQDFAHLCSKH
jgi:hypothetical protein